MFVGANPPAKGILAGSKYRDKQPKSGLLIAGSEVPRFLPSERDALRCDGIAHRSLRDAAMAEYLPDRCGF
jgi:hypothetical protein